MRQNGNVMLALPLDLRQTHTHTWMGHLVIEWRGL